MAVIGNKLPLLHQRREKHAFCRPALVSGENVFEAHDILDCLLKTVITLGAGVRFISAHDTRPLLIAHGVGAAVSEQVNINILSGNVEQVVMRLYQRRFPFCSRGHFDFFNYLDAKRLHKWNGHKLSFIRFNLN